MLDVAIVTPRYPPHSEGGGEKSAQLLATGLADAERVDTVTVFSFDGRERVMKDGVRVVRLGTVSSTVTELQNLVAGNRLRHRLSEFDIVHGYNMELHPALGFLSNRYEVPSVATLNSYHFFPASVSNTTSTGLEHLYELVGQPTTGRVLRQYMKRIDAFIALSQAIETIYRENGFSSCRIDHIPNMIDPGFEVPEKEASTSSSDVCTLLYVGTLTENKGVKYLVEALAVLPDEYTLRIVGSGGCEAQLRELIRERDLTDRVMFRGWVPYDEVVGEYASADVFVHPGIWPEPLNRTVLEAMQVGLPVVCTDIGGPPEVLPAEELLCEPENARSLASTIERARNLEGDVGGQNREYVASNHVPSEVVPQIIDLYESVTE